MTEHRFFFTRHAPPARDATESNPVSKEYPDLTEEGVQVARERAKHEIAELVRNAPENSLIFIGGSTDQPRTRQTAEIYGNTLAECRDDLGENVLVITKREVEALVATEPEDQNKKGFQPGRIAGTIRKLQEIAAKHPGKVVIDYPLQLKEQSFAFKDRWTSKDGKKTEYFNELLNKHNQNHALAGEHWLATDGKLEVEGKQLQGPIPQQVAEDYLKGFRRLRDFTEKIFPNRPIVIGEVGHQWDLDAVVTHLGNNGKVDFAGWEKVSQGQGTIKAGEMLEFISNDGGTNVRYRGKDFPFGIF